MTIADLVRPEIRALRPYVAAEQVDDTLRLNANEAPWTNGADCFRRPLNRYPEIRPGTLRRLLAHNFGCTDESLLVTRGTSEAIDLLIRTFCRSGEDNIVTLEPTFSMYGHYAIVQGAGERTVTTSPDEDFAVDIDAVLDACDARTRLVFLCSPNNPTGTSLPRERLVDLLRRRGERSAVVVDEAYVEFSAQASVIELLEEYPNLVVLRTLSKALAFAGARCGAVIGPTDVIALLDAVQAPYALATPVVEYVEDALENSSSDDARRNIGEIVAERERLMQRIAAFDFVEKVWPSDANFFLVRVRDARSVLARCRDERVLLRDFGGDLVDCIRITVGSRTDSDRLLACFGRIDGGKS